MLNVTGGKDLCLLEISEAADLVQKSVDADANIIFGAVIDEKLENEIVITVIATGFTKTAFQDLKLDNIVGEALKNATVSQNTQPTSAPSFADLNSLSSLSSTSSSASTMSGINSSASSISSTRTNVGANNEYKIVDLDIPPFLRRNKD